MTDDVEPDAVPDVVPDVTPEHVVEEAPTPPVHSDELSERVGRIESTVTDLAETVATLIPAVVTPGEDDEERDETPASKPWLNRGFGSH